jgi:putative ATPase
MQAMVIANYTQSDFVTLSAVLAGDPTERDSADLREVLDTALERRRLYQKKTTLFIDEVHRWNKAQQDALLPHVENAPITLIGVTTENPYAEDPDR